MTCDLTICSLIYSADLRVRAGGWESRFSSGAEGYFLRFHNAVKTKWGIKGSSSRWEKKDKKLNLTHRQFFSKSVTFLKMNNRRIWKTKWKTSRNRAEFLPIFLNWENICYSRITKRKDPNKHSDFHLELTEGSVLEWGLPEVYRGFKKIPMQT